MLLNHLKEVERPEMFFSGVPQFFSRPVENVHGVFADVGISYECLNSVSCSRFPPIISPPWGISEFGARLLVFIDSSICVVSVYILAHAGIDLAYRVCIKSENTQKMR